MPSESSIGKFASNDADFINTLVDCVCVRDGRKPLERSPTKHQEVAPKNGVMVGPRFLWSRGGRPDSIRVLK